MTEKAVIIIPTYNEKDVIAETILALQQHIASVHNFKISILIYDSNSPDGTLDIVKTLQQQYDNICLVVEPSKSGLGSAYVKAMQYAMEHMQADVVIEYDADGSHQPQYIIPMLQKIADGYDVVVGSRYVPGGSIPSDWGVHRKLISVFGNWTARAFLTTKYTDFTSGFRATRTRYLKQVPLTKLLSKQYAYKLHLYWALHKAGAQITEIPIVFIDRQKGYSKFPRNNITDSLRVVMTLRARELYRYLKVCLVGLSGAIIQLAFFNLFRLWTGPVSSTALAVEIAIISNFFLNNVFSFRDRKHPIKSWQKLLVKLGHFNAWCLISLGLQTLIMFLGTNYFGMSLFEENILVVIGIAFASVVNYVVYNKFIWRKSH